MQFVNPSPFKVLPSSINYIFSCLFWKILKIKVVDNLSSLWRTSHHILIILIFLFVFSVLDVEPEGSCLVGNFHAIQLHTIFENLEKNSSHQLIIYQKILVYFIFKRSRICINSASHASLIWSTLPNHDIK